MLFLVTGWLASLERVVELRIDAPTSLDAKSKAEDIGLLWVVVESLPPGEEPPDLSEPP